MEGKEKKGQESAEWKEGRKIQPARNQPGEKAKKISPQKIIGFFG
jgi:hypothetical protein